LWTLAIDFFKARKKPHIGLRYFVIPHSGTAFLSAPTTGWWPKYSTAGMGQQPVAKYSPPSERQVSGGLHERQTNLLHTLVQIFVSFVAAAGWKKENIYVKKGGPGPPQSRHSASHLLTSL